jgi:hypothetical protein
VDVTVGVTVGVTVARNGGAGKYGGLDQVIGSACRSLGSWGGRSCPPRYSAEPLSDV